jgi:hypothetical protein
MNRVLLALTIVAGAAGCRPANSGATPEPERVSVHDVLTKPSLVGHLVQVTGTCLGYSTPIAKGPPPRTRSDWQLEDAGEAVWVTGPLPEGCTATTPGSVPGPIRATVAQDTIPSLGGEKPTPRQYLVRK